MSFEGRYSDEDRVKAVDLYVQLVTGGMSRRAAGDTVQRQIGPSRATVAAWAEEDEALVPPTHADVKRLRETIVALNETIHGLQSENARLRRQPRAGVESPA